MSGGGAAAPNIRALLVDDEPLARDGVRLLAEREPDFTVVGECGSAAEARRSIEALAPDVVFLDVEMPGPSGLDVVRALDPATAPLVVFVTAYEEHAVRAFDLHAVDYLLKPLDEERFRDAARRVRGTLAAVAREAAHDRLVRAVDALRRGIGAGEPPDAVDESAHAAGAGGGGGAYLERVSLRVGGRLVVVRAAEVDWVAADGDYVRFHAGGRSYLARMTMAQLERRLDPRRFVRVHRSAIANLDAVRNVDVGSHGDHVLTLRDGSRVRLSRSYRDAVLAALGAV
ncbi:MAG TPA: response regulator [Gemmatimonadaceae bacterium]|nr:response regulator [Gemmatimonadaceae bacterium]